MQNNWLHLQPLTAPAGHYLTGKALWMSLCLNNPHPGTVLHLTPPQWATVQMRGTIN